jgi:peroxiredoxin
MRKQRCGRGTPVWAATLALSLGFFGADSHAGPGELVGQPAPDFVLKSSAGANTRLSEYRGQVVIVNFWAPWCSRCTTQLEQYARLKQRHGAAGLEVLAVNIDPAAQGASDLAKRLQLTVLRDSEQAVAKQYELYDLPLTLLVDATGRVRQIHGKGTAADEAAQETELVALLRE